MSQRNQGVPLGAVRGASGHHKAKHPKKPMSAAQFQAFLHFVRTHQAQAAARKKQAARRKHGAILPAGYERAEDSYWILGGNDIMDTCAMTAIANSLLYEQRSRTADDEIKAAGEELGIKTGLQYIEDYGLNGWELSSKTRIRPDLAAIMSPGTILGLMTPDGPHAVMTIGGWRIVSWGQIIRLAPPMIVEEAWRVSWLRGREGQGWLRADQ